MAAADLRTRIDTAAVPVAADRFFFTDENITDDPLRYVTYRGLVAALSDRTLRGCWRTIHRARSPHRPQRSTRCCTEADGCTGLSGSTGPPPTTAYRNFATSDLPVGWRWGGCSPGRSVTVQPGYQHRHLQHPRRALP